MKQGFNFLLLEINITLLEQMGGVRTGSMKKKQEYGIGSDTERPEVIKLHNFHMVGKFSFIYSYRLINYDLKTSCKFSRGDERQNTLQYNIVFVNYNSVKIDHCLLLVAPDLTIIKFRQFSYLFSW